MVEDDRTYARAVVFLLSRCNYGVLFLSHWAAFFMGFNKAALVEEMIIPLNSRIFGGRDIAPVPYRTQHNQDSRALPHP